MSPRRQRTPEEYQRRIAVPIMLNVEGWALEVFGSRIYVVRAIASLRTLRGVKNLLAAKKAEQLGYRHARFFRTRLGAVRAAKKLMRMYPKQFRQILIQT